MKRTLNHTTLIPFTCENILQAKRKCRDLKIKFKLVGYWLLVDERKINKLK